MKSVLRFFKFGLAFAYISIEWIYKLKFYKKDTER